MLAVDLTNPDLVAGRRLVAAARDAAPVRARSSCGTACCYERLRVSQLRHARRSRSPLVARLRRRLRRHLRGARHAARAARRRGCRPIVDGDDVRARLRGPRRRRAADARSSCDPPPRTTSAGRVARFELALAPQATRRRCSRHAARASTGRGRSRRRRLRRGAARRRAEALARRRRELREIDTSSEQFNDWLDRSARRPAHDDRPTRRTGPYPVRRRAVVQHAVRPRRHHHRARDAVGRTRRSRAACSRYLAATQADARRRRAGRRAGQDPARDARRRDGGARRGPVRPLLRQRRRDAAVRHARRRVLRAHRRPRVRRRASGRTSSARSTGSTRTAIRDGDGFVEYARQIADRAWCSRAGRTRTTRSSTPTARSPRRRSRCARCRATSTPRGAARRGWPTRSGDAARAERLRAQARALRERFERRVLVRGARHLRAGARRRQAAVPGAHVECRPLPVRRHRRRRSARGASRDTLMRDAIVLRLGHPHASPPAKRATTRCPTTTARSGRTTTRSSPPGFARYGFTDAAARVLDRRCFDASAVRRSAPAAGAVLRLPPAAGRRARRSIRSPARRRRGRRRRSSCCCSPCSACDIGAADRIVRLHTAACREFLDDVRMPQPARRPASRRSPSSNATKTTSASRCCGARATCEMCIK